MSDNSSAVFGIYSTPAALEAAVNALRARGFQSTDISILSIQKAAPGDGVPADPAPAPAAGVGAAAALGGALGWLVGLSALAIAGSVFIVAGPIMAALARMGVAASDLAGTLRTFGVSEVEAERYQSRVASGDTLLSVHTNDPEWFAQGKLVLEETGADAISTTRQLAANELLSSARPPTDLAEVSPTRAVQ